MKHHLMAFVVSLFCSVFLLGFHLMAPTLLNQYEWKGSVSWTNIDQDYLGVIVQYHETHPVFAGRPLTTGLIELVRHAGHVGYGSAFVLVEFFLLTLVGYTLYLLARQLSLRHGEALLSVVALYTSYTVLFAYAASIYTYDEPLQYIFIFLALIFLLRKRLVVAGTLFFLALCARETTVILFPALLYFTLTYRSQGVKILSKKTFFDVGILYIIPCILYFITLTLWLHSQGLLGASGGYLAHDRFTNLWFNFQNRSFAIESLAAPILTLVWPVLLYFVGRNFESRTIPRPWRIMFGMTVVINTAIVLVTAYARESRLFALPLIFLWPFLGHYIHVIACELGRQYHAWRHASLFRQAGYVIVLLSATGLFCLGVGSLLRWLERVYYPTAPGNFEQGYRWYIAIMIMTSGIGACLFIYHFLRPTRVPPSCG